LAEEKVVVRDALRREHVEVTRVPVDREVAEAPPIRSEGDVTIVPVLEERLVVEKRLFLVEELHLRRMVTTEGVELPATLRRTHVEVERTQLDQQENT
jgi:stress response protein YsnF